jgi:fructokinase
VVFAVIVGTGVGAGITIDGVPLNGRHAIAGEWGHNPLPWPRDDESPGPACYCGRTGCIETFLSGPGMARDHERRTAQRLTPPEIAVHAMAGHEAAEATLARYEHRMARALATVINVLDPDVIVLGGGMSNLERLYVMVPDLWPAFVFGATGKRSEAASSPETSDLARVKTRLVRAAHGDSSGVRGAAWLWPDDSSPR